MWVIGKKKTLNGGFYIYIFFFVMCICVYSVYIQYIYTHTLFYSAIYGLNDVKACYLKNLCWFITMKNIQIVMALSLYFSTWIHLFPNTNESTSSWWSPHVSHFNQPISSYFPRSFPSFWWNPMVPDGSYGIFRFPMAPWRNPWRIPWRHRTPRHRRARCPRPRGAAARAPAAAAPRVLRNAGARPRGPRRVDGDSTEIRWRSWDHNYIIYSIYIHI